MRKKIVYIDSIEAKDHAKIVLKNFSIENAQFERLCQNEKFLSELAEIVVKELFKRSGKILYDKFDQQCKDFVQSKASQLVALPENCSTKDVISVFDDPQVKRNALYGYIALLLLSIAAFIFLLAEVIIHLNTGVNLAERLRFYLLIVGLPSVGSLLCLLFAWIIAKIITQKRVRFRLPCVLVAIFVAAGIILSCSVKTYEDVNGQIRYVQNTGEETYTALLLPTDSQGIVTYTIPKEHDGKLVTKVGRLNYETPIQIDAINFDADAKIEIIEPYTFANCYGYKTSNDNQTELTIKLPNSVQEIGVAAFYRCENLVGVTLSNHLTSIADNTFAYCTNLKEIVIPESVSSIGKSVFLGCEKLESLTVPFVGTNVDDRARTLDYLFCEGASSLENNYIPSSLRSVEITAANAINSYTFQNCNNISSIVLNNDIAYIGHYAFANCSSLSKITIPSKSTSLGAFTFYGCSDLQEVTIDDNSQLTKIDAYAFYNCENLTRIFLPIKVNYIGSYAFYNCKKLDEVGVANLTTWCNIEFTNDTSNPMYYAKYLRRKSGQNWAGIQGNIVLDEGIIVIPAYTFKNCFISSIYIPSSVITIERGAFYHSSSLQMVEFAPQSQLKIICENVFVGCEKLKSLTLPANLETMERAFSNNDALESISFEDGSKLTEIVPMQFAFLSNLKTVTFEGTSQLTTIGWEAFWCCRNLTAITIPETVTSIGFRAFYECDNLKNIVFSDNSQLTTIEDSAFYACISLVDITIPDNVLSIDKLAFCMCVKLKNVHFGQYSKLKSIGYGVFYSCQNLESIELPQLVEEIDGVAFDDCEKLTIVNYLGDISSWCDIKFNSISANPLSNGATLYINNKPIEDLTFTESITTINKYAFYGCSSITKLTIPITIIEIELGSFVNCSNLESVIIPKRLANSDSELQNIFGSNFRNIDFQFTYEEEFEIDGSILTEYIGTSKDVVIPDGIVQINGSAFRNMGFIESLTLPASVVNIGSSAFQGCNGLIKVNYLGEISDWCGIVFENASANPLYLAHDLYINDERVTDLIIPNKVLMISAYAFINANFTSVIICENVTDIGTQAFSYNTMKSITIPQNIVNMGSNAFSNCDNLATITWNATACLTGLGLFSNCRITTINISENVTSFPRNAFWDMLPDIGDDYFSSYRNVYYDGDLTSWCNIDFASRESNPLQFGSLYIKGVLVSQLNFSNAVTEIKAFAFARCRSLTSIMFSQTITKIGTEAFIACTNIQSLDIPQSIESIGAEAFGYCHSLIEVKVNAKTIDGGAFGSCMALSQVTIGKDVESMGTQVFYGCESLVRAIFKEPRGWKIKGYYDNSWSDLSVSDLQNSELAATYLKSSSYYEFYYWQRT